MFDCILIRYGEIALKSPVVRREFENRLISNINSGLKLAGLNYKVNKNFGRIFVLGYNKKAENVLKRVFGIVSFSPVITIEADLEKIKKQAVKLAKKSIKKSDSFAVKCNRVGTHNFTSQDIQKIVGTEIVKAMKLKVDLTNPDKIIGIDIRSDKTYLFTERIKGSGGVPLGTGGKVVSVIENFNGVVASWLFMKRGCFVFPIFIKSRKNLDILKNWCIGGEIRPIDLKRPDLGEIEKICREKKAEAVITGETLINFKNIKSAFPVFRPLVGFDKKYLKSLGKKIKTS